MFQTTNQINDDDDPKKKPPKIKNASAKQQNAPDQLEVLQTLRGVFLPCGFSRYTMYKCVMFDMWNNFMYIYPSIYLSIFLSFFLSLLAFFLSVCLSFFLSFLSFFVSFFSFLSLFLSFYLYVHIYIFKTLYNMCVRTRVYCTCVEVGTLRLTRFITAQTYAEAT